MTWILSDLGFHCLGLSCLYADSCCIRHLLPNTCGFCVSRAEVGRLGTPAFCVLWQVSLAWCLRLRCLSDCISCCVLGGMHVACRDCSSNVFFPNFWGWASLKKFNKERRACGTKFYIITLISFEGHVSSVVLNWFSSNMRVALSGQILEDYL